MALELPPQTRCTGTAVKMSLGVAQTSTATSSDWRHQLPVLMGSGITLRDLRMSDAPALLALLTTEGVTRFISPPPTTLEGFERFISWATCERQAGRYVCFAVVPAMAVKNIIIGYVDKLGLNDVH